MGPRTRPPGRKVNSQHPLARGLVSFHLCLPNLSSGGVFYDIVNHYDVTLQSIQTGYGFEPGKRPGGLSGKVVSLDGVSGHSAKRTASVPVSGFPLTFACWFKPASFAGGTENALMGLDDGTTSNQICMEQLIGAGVPNVGAFLNNASGEVASTYGVGFADWNFATATFAQNVQYAYQNGTNKSVTGSATGTPTGLTNFRIGGIGGYSIYLSGSIDCCMVYNRVLSDAEVMQLYIETKNRCPSLLRRVSSPKIFYPVGVSVSTPPVGNLHEFNQSVKSASFF